MPLHDQIFVTLAMACLSLAALTLLIGGALRGWRGWLDLKHAELASGRAIPEDQTRLPAAERIEMADLKERIRKLEAIAAGVDL